MSQLSFDDGPGGFYDSMTLKQARDLLRELAYEGHICPCCTQFAKVYRRKIHATMAYHLVKFLRAVPVGEWGHYPTLFPTGRGGDWAKLAYWNLVEEETTRREDGGRAGWWRMLFDGERWVREPWTTVPKYALIYDGRFLRYDGEECVTIRDALGDRFDYEELMKGV